MKKKIIALSSVLTWIGSIVAGTSLIGTGVDKVSDAKRNTSLSLSKFAKQTNIMSKMYIEEELANEDIIVPLISMLHQIYVAFIITSINLQNLMSNYRTIRSAINTISTESFLDLDELIELGFETGLIEPSNERIVELESKAQRLVAGRLIELKFNVPMGMQTTTTRSEDTVSTSVSQDLNVPNSTNTTETGDRVQRTINTGTQEVVLYVNTMLLPNILNKATMGSLISANASLSVSKRFRQALAGEISFFSDFLLSKDIVEAHAKSLKEDTTNTVYNISADSTNKLMKKIAFTSIGINKNNMANSIIITDKKTFEGAASKFKLNFDKASDRQKFFTKTMTIMVVVVDTTYNIVEIYYNGIDHKGEYSFDLINSVGGSKKDADLKQIMTMFSSGMAPSRF